MTTIIDLGAGSSLPTIRALLKAGPKMDIKVIAIDNDEEALSVSKGNVSLCGLSNRYTFVVDNMLRFLQHHSFEQGHIITSNPPYLPIPEDIDGSFYGPVNGGVDGTMIVALRWCSLSNPTKIIEMIAQFYEVRYVEAHKARFGKIYLGAPAIKNHISSQAKSGRAVYYVRSRDRITCPPTSPLSKCKSGFGTTIWILYFGKSP